MGSLSLLPKGKMTRKGKATVSRNAPKHGLRGAAVVVRGVEGVAERKRHLAAVFADAAPRVYVEAELTRILAEVARRACATRLLPTQSQAAILTRYEASIDRTIAHCLTELERIQRVRAGEFGPPPLKATVST